MVTVAELPEKLRASPEIVLLDALTDKLTHATADAVVDGAKQPKIL